MEVTVYANPSFQMTFISVIIISYNINFELTCAIRVNDSECIGMIFSDHDTLLNKTNDIYLRVKISIAEKIIFKGWT